MTKEQLITYRNWIVYQIYPKSFADSNGDGVGDLQGIISKLGYIKSLSADAIWISPCYPSPCDDNGYDVSDYRDIAPEYGSLADMDELIKKAHALEIKIILDLVANHTSSSHEWFQQSRKSKDNRYADYYYWSDEPLNGWKSVFTKKSAWIYDEGRKQYYLASFAPTQPDLNWTNAQVRKEIQEVVDFWVARGVDGFRCDVLDMISKDFDREDGNGNGRRLHGYIRELFDRKTTRDLFIVGECWSSTIDNVQLFCGLDRKEICCTFQNDHRAFGFDEKDGYARRPYALKEVAKTLSAWQKGTIERDMLYTLFWENHDSPRVISRFGDEGKRYQSGTMLATMLNLLCGVVFLYEGQELGLINTKFTRLEDFDDIEAKHYYQNHAESLSEGEIFARINDFGRDNGRRMMPWTEEKIPSWIPTDERQLAYSVATQEKENESVLQYYRKLLAFRKNNEAFSKGTYQELAVTDEYFVYERSYRGKTFVIVCNFGAQSTVEGIGGKVVLSNLNRQMPTGIYAAYECAVIEKE